MFNHVTYTLIINSQEALAEAKAYLNTKEAYIDTSGNLRYGCTDAIVTFVLYNYTRGLVT